MAQVYLEHRCPNRPTDSDQECRSELGGLSIESLETYPFTTPLVDIRYCKRCKILWKITITDNTLVPKYDLIEKGEKLKFQQPQLGVISGKRGRNG